MLGPSSSDINISSSSLPQHFSYSFQHPSLRLGSIRSFCVVLGTPFSPPVGSHALLGIRNSFVLLQHCPENFYSCAMQIRSNVKKGCFFLQHSLIHLFITFAFVTANPGPSVNRVSSIAIPFHLMCLVVISKNVRIDFVLLFELCESFQLPCVVLESLFFKKSRRQLSLNGLDPPSCAKP